MRVSTKHSESTYGLIFKKPCIEVKFEIIFSDEERFITKQNDLDEHEIALLPGVFYLKEGEGYILRVAA